MRSNIWDDLFDENIFILIRYTNQLKDAIELIQNDGAVKVQESQQKGAIKTAKALKEFLETLADNEQYREAIGMPESAYKKMKWSLPLMETTATKTDKHGKKVRFDKENVLDDALLNIYAYLTELNISVDEQAEYVFKVYAWVQYNEHHLTSFWYDKINKMVVSETDDADLQGEYMKKYPDAIIDYISKDTKLKNIKKYRKGLLKNL